MLWVTACNSSNNTIQNSSLQQSQNSNTQETTTPNPSVPTPEEPSPITPEPPKEVHTGINKVVPVFIIGDSSTHNAMDRNGVRVGWGWGDVLGEIMKDPTLVTNYARSGQSSLTFTTKAPRSNPTLKHWDKTKQGILASDTTQGGFLMMQFAGNDAAVELPIDVTRRTAPSKNIQEALNKGKVLPDGLTSFEENLRRYIDFALKHNVTPVLVTSPSTRSLLYHTCDDDDPKYAGQVGCDARRAYWIRPDKSQHPFAGQTLDYPQAMRDLQKEYIANGKTVLLLDLTVASYNFYLNDAKQHGYTGTSEINNYLTKYGYGSDDVHLNKLGADKIANLVKELACKTDTGLCYQFK